MSMQLPLPGTWPQNMSRRDPTEALEEIKRDKEEATYAIELLLDRYAVKHGLSHHALNKAILGYVGDMLGDLFFDKEEELRGEVEEDIARENQ